MHDSFRGGLVEELPRALLEPLDAGALPGSGPVLLQFRNQFDGPVSVLFEPEGGLILYTYAGGFVGNLVRALLILLLQLGLLAAVGVTRTVTPD